MMSKNKPEKLVLESKDQPTKEEIEISALKLEIARCHLHNKLLLHINSCLLDMNTDTLETRKQSLQSSQKYLWIILICSIGATLLHLIPLFL